MILNSNCQGKWSAASIERFKELCDSGAGLQMKVVRAEGTACLGRIAIN